MTTKVKSSAKSRKSGANRVISSTIKVESIVSSASAPAGAGVAAGGVPAPIKSGGSAGAGSHKSAKESINDKLSAAAAMGDELSIIDFRSRVAARWAAPEWSGAAALRVVLAGAGLTEEQISAAVAAAARKSGENLAAVCPSVAEVVEHIRTNFDNEFKNLCGCSCPAAADVRIYSYTGLSVATITANSKQSDYVVSTSVPAGASASAVVAAVMSVRVLVDYRRRVAAARASDRNELKEAAASLVRRAGRLGISSAVLGRYLSLLAAAVPAADNKEMKRLQNNLSRCWGSLRTLENDIMLASPAGCWGAAAPIEDNDGGWCFPTAGLPASAPAKVRKMWAKRVRLLSSISTLETLLSRCA